LRKYYIFFGENNGIIMGDWINESNIT